METSSSKTMKGARTMETNHEQRSRPARPSDGWRMGRTGGIAALLYGLWVVYLLVLQMIVFPGAGLSAAAVHDPAQVLPFVRSHAGLFTLLWAPELLAAFLLPVLVLALDDRMAATAPGRVRVASACGLLGTFLIIAHTLVQNAVIPLGSVYKQDPAGAAAAFRASDAIAGWLSVGGLFAVGAWIVLVCWVALQRGGLPRWSAYVGLVAGVLALLTLVAGLPVGILGLLVWSAMLATLLLRRGAAGLVAHTETAR
jgi:Domain of unknown function (DUF4386)